ADAFHVAVTRTPGRSPSSRAAASEISAASGWPAARPTRTRPPTAVSDTTSAGRRLRTDPLAGASGGSTTISHGKTEAATRPVAGAVLDTQPPPSSVTRVRPGSPGAAVPVSTTAPAKSATKAEAGAAAS